jgi:hypothetical protein
MPRKGAFVAARRIITRIGHEPESFSLYPRFRRSPGTPGDATIAPEPGRKGTLCQKSR